jgi:hypothetical protein
VGETIDVDAWAAEREDGVAEGAEDHDAVRALTAVIDSHLRAAAPNYPDWPTAAALETVAEVVLNDVDPRPADGEQYGDEALVAGRLNRVAEPIRSDLVAAGAAYETALRQARTSDRVIAGDGSGRSWWWILTTLVVVLLLPYALIGLLLVLVPLLIVTIVSRLPIAPAERATFVPAAALLTFLGEWALFSWQSLREGGWEFGLLGVLLFPFFVAALFYVWERLALVWRRWRHGRRPRGAQAAELAAFRAQVSDLAWGAL